MVCKNKKCEAALHDGSNFCHICGARQSPAQNDRPKRLHGDGSYVERKDGRIELRITTGLGIRKSFYGKTKKECRKKYEEFQKGITASVEKTSTVAEWSKQWLELYKKNKVGFGTYRNYEMYVDNHILPSLGHMKLDKVRPAHIAGFYKDRTHLSTSALKHINLALKGIFDTAVDNNLCITNPVKPLGKIGKAPDDTIKYFNAEQIAQIVEAAKSHSYGIYITLPLYTGMRMGEILALKWENIDLEERLITVSRAIAKSDSGNAEKSTKSEKTRTIGIPENLCGTLDGLTRSGAYLFSDNGTSPISQFSYWYRYKMFFDETEIEYLSVHKCRHTYATYLLRGGADLRSVQEALGHHSVSVTEKYTHKDMEDIRQTASMLNY